MGRRRWMNDGGLGVSEVGCERHELGPIDELPGRLAATCHLKCQHPAKTLLLTDRQGMTGMVRQPAVRYRFYQRMLSQPFSQTLRVVRMVYF